MTKINFESIYGSFSQELSNSQKKLDVKSPLGVFYGLSEDGYLRLAFLSASNPPKMESTKVLRVTQGMEATGVFWTCFDLMQIDAKKVFFAFCENLVDSIAGILSEKAAMNSLKKRYISWKTLFKNESKNKISLEVLQGLYGEMYFLKNYMIGAYGASVAVNSWSGPDAKSKDFSVDTDWFELKTVSVNSTAVRITSLAQLSSEHDGHLVIVRVERMADQFTNGESSVGELFSSIMNQIDDEAVEEVFLNKLASYGFDISDSAFDAKFDVKAVNKYLVNEDFPRLTEKRITYSEISDVDYSLIINSLKKYIEE